MKLYVVSRDFACSLVWAEDPNQAKSFFNDANDAIEVPGPKEQPERVGEFDAYGYYGESYVVFNEEPK